MQRMMRATLIVAILGVLLVGGAAPALADPPGPSNYRSRVDSVEPTSGSVVARIVGGDSFLEVRVQPGTAMEILGYEGEPYVRIDVAGVVFVNEASPAFWLNQDRYAQSAVPAGADATAEPEWVRVGEGGVYAWHDHRIHWMSPDLPPQIDPDVADVVSEWTVAIGVGGVPGTIEGTLSYEPSVSPIPWIALILLAALPVLFLRRMAFGPALWLAVGGAAGLVVGVAQVMVTPAGAGGALGAVAGPLVGLVGGIAAAGLEARRRGSGRYVLLVGGVGLGVWAVLRFSVFTLPVLGTSLPAPIERAAVAVALGASIAVVASVVMEIVSPPRPVSPARPVEV